MHIFFLLLQEVVGHCIESVTPQLVVSHKNKEQVELNPALNVDHFVLPLPHLLALQDSLFDLRLDALDSTQEVEVVDVEVLSPVEQVGHVKVVDVIPRDNVGVSHANKLGPLL